MTPDKPSNPWMTLAKWLIAATVILLIATVAIPRSIDSFMTGTGKGVGEAISKPIERTGDALAKLTATNVTNIFETQVLAAHSANSLLVATFKGSISIRKVEESGWTRAEVEVRKPAEVPLYLPLRKNFWRFQVIDNTLLVLAPAIEFGKPSVDNVHVQRTVLDSSWRISETRMLREAEQELDERAPQLAAAQAIAAREQAREGVATFIREWLLKPQFPANKEMPLKVTFPGEPSAR